MEFAEVMATSMGKALSGQSRVSFRGNSTHLLGVSRFGAPGVYVRANSGHPNEVARPRSPRAESNQVIPQIVALASCLPRSQGVPGVSALSSLHRAADVVGEDVAIAMVPEVDHHLIHEAAIEGVVGDDRVTEFSQNEARASAHSR
jgi:hypothetical protein